MQQVQVFTVYEYGRLRVGEGGFMESHRVAADNAHSPEDGFYDLIHKGIRFKGKVGLLQFGSFAIEVLPKADEGYDDDHWRGLLLQMMRRAGYFSADRIPDAYAGQTPTMLDLLLGQYLAELEALLHQGLIKRYIGREGNVSALRGRLLFGKNIQKNLVHAERFYTAHTTYSVDHALNQVLGAALAVVPRLAIGNGVRSAAQRLALAWPEAIACPAPQAALALVARIRQDRKAAPFGPALRLATLILSHLHPDTRTGPRPVFSLMLSMDRLWEAWLRAELRRALPHVQVGHESGVFYTHHDETHLSAKTDITLHHPGQAVPFAILDAKWKRPDRAGVSEQDLRQVYAYLHRFGATVGALVYPGKVFKAPRGSFWLKQHHCHIAYVPVEPNAGQHWAEALMEELKS